MTTRPGTNRSAARQTLLLVVACAILIAVAQAPVGAQTKTSQVTQSAVTEALRTHFGSALGLATAFTPSYLTGDFNGDGVQDVLILVRINGRRRELPADVRVLNPFGYGAKVNFPVDPSANPTLALAIIHGGGTGWQTSQTSPRGKFLLLGESPILILENSRAASSQPEDRNNLMEIIRQRGRRTRGAPRLPATAKGDAILLGTEAAESTLYWNGKTYRWEESEGGE